MRISRNENYSRWVHKSFEHVQNFHADLQKLHALEEHCLNRLSLSLSLPEWPGMIPRTNTNHVELSILGRSAVDSAVRLGHYTISGTLKYQKYLIPDICYCYCDYDYYCYCHCIIVIVIVIDLEIISALQQCKM